MNKKSIPLIYSVLVGVIVLLSISTTDYYVLNEKYQKLTAELKLSANDIFHSLENAVKNQDKLAITIIMDSLKTKIRDNSSLLQISIINFSEEYYYTSTEPTLTGYSISESLKNVLLSNDNQSSLLRGNELVKGESRTVFRFINSIKILNTEQTFYISSIFGVTGFETEFNQYRINVIMISLIAVLIAFICIYLLSYFLSYKLIILDQKIESILKNNFKINSNSKKSFLEINLIDNKLKQVAKTIFQQQKIIKELEKNQNSSIKNSIVEETDFTAGNYLCVLFKVDYNASKVSANEFNHKEFLSEILNSIIKNTYRHKVKLINFGDYFLLILNAYNFFDSAVNSVKKVQRNIITSSTDYKKFGILSTTVSVAMHYGEMKSFEIKEQGINDSIIFGKSFKILNQIIDKAKDGEILITKEVVDKLMSNKVTNINFAIPFLGKNYNLYLLEEKSSGLVGNSQKQQEIEKTDLFGEDKNPMSVNIMLEDTFNQ